MYRSILALLEARASRSGHRLSPGSSHRTRQTSRESVESTATTTEGQRNSRADRSTTRAACSPDGDRAAACSRFEQSDKLKHTFGTAVNLGDCALHDEQLERAWLLYNEAVRLAKREGDDDLVLFARDA
jgi:hypothetical protein